LPDFTPRQQEIITTSIEIINAEGIQHLTIKNIANSINITEGAIYRHFKGKIDILLDILLNFKTVSLGAIQSVLSDEKSSIKQIELILQIHFRKFTEMPALASVIFSEEIFQDDERLSREVYTIMKTNFNRIMDIIKQGQANNEIRDDLPAEHLALIIMGALRLQVSKWRLSGFSFDLEEKGQGVWNSLEKMIRGK